MTGRFHRTQSNLFFFIRKGVITINLQKRQQKGVTIWSQAGAQIKTATSHDAAAALTLSKPTFMTWT
jgi:hypothetical protein